MPLSKNNKNQYGAAAAAVSFDSSLVGLPNEGLLYLLTDDVCLFLVAFNIVFFILVNSAYMFGVRL